MPPRPILGTIALTISPYSGRSIYHACNQLRGLLPANIPSLPYSSLHQITLLTHVPHTIEPFLRTLASETRPFQLRIELPLYRRDALFNGQKQPFYYRHLTDEHATPGEGGRPGKLFDALAGQLQLGAWEGGEETKWVPAPKSEARREDGEEAVKGTLGTMISSRKYPTLRLPLMKIKRTLDAKEEGVVRDVLETGGQRLIDTLGVVDVTGISWIPGPGAQKITSRLNDTVERDDTSSSFKNHWRIQRGKSEGAIGRNTILDTNSSSNSIRSTETNGKTGGKLAKFPNQDRSESTTQITPLSATSLTPSVDRGNATTTHAITPTAPEASATTSPQHSTPYETPTRTQIPVRQIYCPLTGDRSPAQQQPKQEDKRSILVQNREEARFNFKLSAEEADSYDEHYTPSRDPIAVRRESESKSWSEMQSLEDVVREALERRARLGPGLGLGIGRGLRKGSKRRRGK